MKAEDVKLQEQAQELNEEQLDEVAGGVPKIKMPVIPGSGSGYSEQPINE